MVGILRQIPQYRLARAFGYPRKLPLSVTLSLTYACNSRCKTCNVWQKKADNLSLQELEQVFASLGKAPYWFTLSGGEPFLRKDIADICESIWRNCRPGIINIPTNGFLCDVIPQRVEQILAACPGTNVVINLSLDAVGEKHDEIRNLPQSWEKALKTYHALRELRRPGFELGVHTVVSRYSIAGIPEIYSYVMQELKPDSYVTEIAEQRVELGTIGADITPDPEEYGRVADFLRAELGRQHFKGLSRITQAFRLQYYELVKQVLAQRRQVLPCYAGVASAQIAPDGDVWTCCIKAEAMGNLREAGYDFARIWHGPQARAMRRSIKSKECYCPLANAAYTNMLCSIPTLAKVGWKVLTG